MKTKGLLVLAMIAMISINSMAQENEKRFGIELNSGVSFATRELGGLDLNTGFGFEGISLSIYATFRCLYRMGME